MSTFGDIDPEDAYDAGDPPAERLAVLARAVYSIRAEAFATRSRHAARFGKVRELLQHLVDARDAEADEAADLLDQLAEVS